MVNCAYIFPGQGAQYVGMGKDLYNNYDIAKETFQQANRALNFDITKLCFEGPAEELKKTEHCQPAILTVSIATLRAFRLKNKKFNPKFALGLSLGEYSALVAAEAMAFGDAVILVRKRGQFMEEAARQYTGQMACIIGLERQEVEDVCEESGAEIANLNCPSQIVISGKTEIIKKATELAKTKGAKKSIILDVSGPFHSSLMSIAGQKLKEELDKIQIFQPEFPVVSNVTANSENMPDEIKENLIDQVSCTTRWEDSIRRIAQSGITTYLEIGPGKVLSGLLKRIDPSLIAHNIGTSTDIETLT